MWGIWWLPGDIGEIFYWSEPPFFISGLPHTNWRPPVYYRSTEAHIRHLQIWYYLDIVKIFTRYEVIIAWCEIIMMWYVIIITLYVNITEAYIRHWLMRYYFDLVKIIARYEITIAWYEIIKPWYAMIITLYAILQRNNAISITRNAIIKF